MLIGKKLNSLILGVIVSIFIALLVFAINYIPTMQMGNEKDSLFTLDSAVSELRAEINILTLVSFDNQLEEITAKHEYLSEQFQMLEDLDSLKANSEINESLEIIARLYTLYEDNYKRMIVISKNLGLHLEEVFLSDNIKVEEVPLSSMLKRYDQKDEVLSLIDSLHSSMSILDSNLVSTHMVIVEQFAVIDKLIDQNERQSYIFGIIIVLLAGAASFFAASIIASKITKSIRAAGSGIERMSEGDLTDRFDIQSKDELHELGENLNNLIGNLKNVFMSMKNSSNSGVKLKEELITAANQTSTASSEIAANSQGIAQQFAMLTEKVKGSSEANESLKSNLESLEGLVQEQTTMVEESTSAVTEMISSINNVTDITSKKKSATDMLVKTSELGGNKLNATINVINEINESLDQIKGMATIIQQIASQTNLLAMNAAIEAAHAGDAGRGFAVVADEIRKLAEASSMNSKQISGVLKDVVTSIETASVSGRDTEAAFVEIDREVSGVAQSLDEISSSMDELNIGGKQILEAMTSLQNVSLQVSQGSGKMTEASEQVTEAIEVVSRITSEVSNSANEITIGITEVSGAMSLVTELTSELGDITDTLERESSCFKTDKNLEADSCFDGSDEQLHAEVLNEGETGVTIAEEDEKDVEIETVD